MNSDLHRQILFAVVDGGSADAQFTGHCGTSFPLDHKLDDGLVPC